jgi:molecular chaperone DnaK
MAIENAVSDLKTALAGDDKETIDAKAAALGEASGGLAQKLYAEQAADGAGDAGDADGASASDDVVDAEFEEVDKDDKS